MSPPDSDQDVSNGIHPEHEDYPWTIQIPNHPKRTQSNEYVASRHRMHELVDQLADFAYGDEPFEDHHGGGLWLKDADGWFMVRNMAGIEWSAQFCADPEKVDLLRRNARRLYRAFPEAVQVLGIQALLETPITDAEGIKRWTDSICNASVPLPRPSHVGVLPRSRTGGVHHYPSPITEIDFFKRDSFQLWVETDQGEITAVVPLAPRGSGDGRTRVLLAAAPLAPDVRSPLGRIADEAPQEFGATADEAALAASRAFDEDAILPATHPVSRRAFQHQR
jgi:hypothetical protein